MSLLLQGRSAVVTGGSKGIGKGIARVLSQAGANVLIVARDEAALRATTRELAGTGGAVSYLVADVAEAESSRCIADVALERHGGIDIVVPNAALFPAVAVADLTSAAIQQVLNVNLLSTMLLVQSCIPALQKSECGRVVIISSITGPITGYPKWSIYAASKAAQLGFMRTAALELAPSGITVNAILPGVIVTEAIAEVGPDHIARKSSTIPMKRLGHVDEVGFLVRFLASSEAAFITAQAIVIDGGQVLPESQTESPAASSRASMGAVG